MVSEEIHAMIPDYVRGLLSPGEAKEIEAALDSSPEILPEFEAAQAYYAALNQIPEVKAPADFLDRVNRRIDVKPFWPSLRGLLFEPLYIKLPVELAGLAACLIFVLAVTHPFMLRERLVARQSAPSVTNTLPPAATTPTQAPAGPSQLLSEEKREPAIAESRQPAAQPNFPGPADLTPVRPQETPRKTPREIPREIPREKQSLVAAAAEVIKTEPKPAALATAPALPRPAAPSVAALPSINGIPTLPAASQMIRNEKTETTNGIPKLPAAAQTNRNEKTETTNNIGTIELTYIKTENGPAGQMEYAGEQAAALSPVPFYISGAAEEILRTFDPRFVKTFQDSKVIYACTLPPGRLYTLIEDLGRAFKVTTHLFPYDEENAKSITVSFILQ
jgi:hypothetical protein